MSAFRSVARAAAKQALRRSLPALPAVAPRRLALRSLAPRAAFSAPQARMCSSSRFLSLADDDERSGGADERDGDDEDGDGEDGEGEDGEDGEEEDGDLDLEEEADINDGGVDIDEELDDEIMSLFMEDPAKWTPEKLARKFHLTKPRVEAIIFLLAEESGLSQEEFRAKVREAKEEAAARAEAENAAFERAKAVGDEREVRRLEKRARQALEREEDEELSAEDEAVMLGIDEDAYRNPEFFLLSDEFEGYPPLVRRLGKHGSTDQLYPDEAVALQKLAVNNTVTELKSFAKPTDVKGRWKVAVKDISKKKQPLYVRDEQKALRLATDAETLPRTWVRRPAYFNGLNL
ncbi:hypothetical protein PybrP1_012485 [[Pythium] brassicae (nom. inval.)]|nr:hypothetical protein PybrP1_012485 [[Pythium] brassicae (nom. inval.)]